MAGNDLQHLSDLLVRAAHRQDAAVVLELRSQLSESDVFFPGSWLDGGAFVTNETVENALESFLETTEEDDTIADGSQLMLSQFRAFLTHAADDLFESTEGPWWQLVEVTASDGASAFAVGWVLGSSWEGLDYHLLGVGRTVEEGRSVAKAYCYVNAEDLAARYPATLASIELLLTPVEDSGPFAQDRTRFKRKAGMDAFIKWKQSGQRS